MKAWERLQRKYAAVLGGRFEHVSTRLFADTTALPEPASEAVSPVEFGRATQ